jgi:hypothetical protein
LKAQFVATRNFYFNIPNDDILKSFRESAGLPAPGEDMGGTRNLASPGPRRGGGFTNLFGGTFGQWLSGMSRMYRATNDAPMREKATYLLTEWGKTFGINSRKDAGTGGHYGFDKTVCGLVDLGLYVESDDAMRLLDQVGEWGRKNLNRSRLLPDALADPGATNLLHTSGPPPSGGEWYTLAENLYRAYLLTGDEKYREFAAIWHYPAYWSKFTGSDQIDLHGLHAYSHVNTLSSAAMAYGVTADPHFLQVITGAHDHFQAVQNFATGGYGPVEQLVKDDGSLGRAIEFEGNRLGTGSSFETGCGSWAVFKLGRYLLEFTGAARYGDWIERILYNGISAALPMADHENPFFNDIWTEHGWGPDRGRTFYYSDYRLGGARKEYYWGCWPCCSGTYIQDVVDYHNVIYLHDSDSLYVNLFVPSMVVWRRGDSEIKLTQKTEYPEAETTRIAIATANKTKLAFNLKLRIPEWSTGATVQVNGNPFQTVCSPGSWAAVDREWMDGDVVELHLPMRLRAVPIDKFHPNRVAIAYGPVVLVQEQEPMLKISRQNPAVQLKGANGPLEFATQASAEPLLKPFYAIGYATPYAMYFDV